MIHVQGVEFTEMGMVVTYTTTDGVRKDGALQRLNTLIIAPHPDYAQEMTDIQDMVVALVQEADEDYATAEVVDLAEDEGGDDDEPGMGYGS